MSTFSNGSTFSPAINKGIRPRINLKPLPAAVALALSLSTCLVHAASIQVDSTSDTATGVCRLRDAIIASNDDVVVEGCAAGSGADIIRLLPVAGSTITLNGTRLPAVTSYITIQGESVTIDGAGLSGLFEVDGSSASLNINNLSIINGNASGADHSGAGILVHNGASLTLAGSTVSGNTAASNGGGISVESGGETLKLISSTVSGNVALGSMAGTGIGGGIYVGQPIEGAISISIANTTLSGNTASGELGYGGGLGIYNIDSPNVINTFMYNSTLFGNEAKSIAGGLLHLNFFGGITVINSIISNNNVIETEGANYSPDCDAYMSLLGKTLIGNTTRCNGSGSGTIITGDPMLRSELGDNGGPTRTHAPMAGSPVIDAINTNCFFINNESRLVPVDFTGDQRGFDRHDGKCDLGAVEFNGAALQSGPDFVVNSSDDPSQTISASEGSLLPDERFLTNDGHCNVAPGDCTLRDAVLAANQSDDASVVTFSDELSAPINIDLAGVKPLNVISDLTIQGSSVSIIGVGGDDTPTTRAWVTRNFVVESARLTLDGLNVSNGWALSGPGGGILVKQGAALELINSRVFDGEAKGSGGGVFVSSDSSAALINSDVSSNRAAYHGGGIFVDQGGSLTIEGSTLSSNSAGLGCSRDINTYPNSPEACGGGAIALEMATLIVTSSEISGNFVTSAFGRSNGLGAGIYANNNSELSISNSTLATNTSENGGAIGLSDSSLTLLNSTLSGNNAPFGGGIFAVASTIDVISSTVAEHPSDGSGAGFHLQDSTLTLTNSIISNSTAEDCKDFGGSTVSTLGVNLIKDGGSACGLSDAPNLLTGDPALGPLADNGGPTMTHFPLADSSAINAGDNTLVPEGLEFDQRGTGFPRITETDVDLGSVEWTSTIFKNGFEQPQ